MDSFIPVVGTQTFGIALVLEMLKNMEKWPNHGTNFKTTNQTSTIESPQQHWLFFVINQKLIVWSSLNCGSAQLNKVVHPARERDKFSSEAYLSNENLLELRLSRQEPEWKLGSISQETITSGQTRRSLRIAGWKRGSLIQKNSTREALRSRKQIARNNFSRKRAAGFQQLLDQTVANGSRGLFWTQFHVCLQLPNLTTMCHFDWVDWYWSRTISKDRFHQTQNCLKCPRNFVTQACEFSSIKWIGHSHLPSRQARRFYSSWIRSKADIALINDCLSNDFFLGWYVWDKRKCSWI